MLQFGMQITALGDPLQPLQVERLYQGITHPKQAFKDFLEQLRTVRSIDEQQYKQLKKQLPYFVCGIFHPPVRRKENFAAIHHFLLDLDHLASAELDRLEVAERLKQAPEVAMCFTSPSGDGLKVMFNLSEPCRDAALFSAFYKLFARRFAERWGLQQAIDFQTSDVTRACFMSYDPQAWYNEQAVPVVLEDFIPELDFGKAERDIREAEKAVASQTNRQPTSGIADDEVLLKIKLRLNPLFKARKQKDYYVPAQIEEAIGLLEQYLPRYDLSLKGSAPISYGRKLTVEADKYWAEINVFYGKKGYSVVATTKTGSNAELAKLATSAIEEILFTPPELLSGQ